MISYNQYLKLSGIDRNLTNALDHINKFTVDFIKQKLKEDLISQNVQWQIYKNDWCPLNLYLNSELELKFKSVSNKTDQRIRLSDELGKYFFADVLEFKVIYEENMNKTYMIRRIERDLNSEYPSKWTSKLDVDLVLLDSDSADFKYALNFFTKMDSSFIRLKKV